MDIFTFAKQMEKDGETYYRELMAASKTPGLKKIFLYLADEEARHFEYLKKLEGKEGIGDGGQSRILEDVKNIFIAMKEGKEALDIDTLQATAAFIKARDIEEASRKFYQEKAEEIAGENAKMLFRTLANEEEKHFRIMENIIEFISRPEPGNWLENSEWHHLEEY